MHYCMGKLKTTNVQLTNKKACCCKKADSNKSCCKTKHHFVKLEDNHKASYADFKIQLPVTVIESDYFLAEQNNIIKKNQITYSPHAPPLLNGQSTYLLNCVFRI
ncbi:MAG: hypothetical protein C0459_14310 [Chitinophaga sp.]|nr:hypothetical protein [Chitinophaga sp.]